MKLKCNENPDRMIGIFLFAFVETVMCVIG